LSVSGKTIKLLIMNIHAARAQENKNHVVINKISQKQNSSQSGEPAFQFVDNRSETTTQMQLQKMAFNSPQTNQAIQLKIIANSQTDNPIQNKDLEEEELLQGKFQPTQMKESREAFQLMAADPDFKKKHTANSEEEAIQKSKTRTGKWQYNSIMNWGISLYKSAFDFDETKSGPFSVVNGGWQISKPNKGKGFRNAKIAEVEGDFTGTATKGTDDAGKTVGIANHSDGWKVETKKAEKNIV
jgi:hypothetical protein